MTEREGTHQRPRRRLRNYWVFSAGLAIVWAIVITIRTLLGGGSTLRDTWLIFGGFAVGWISTTIARYVYPPAKRWLALATDTA